MRITEHLKSSFLSGVSFDPDVQEPQDIDISFRKGRSYSFKQVPRAVIDGLVNASSAGEYYHSHIKGQYDA